MIVGCYSLVLYCDIPDCPNGRCEPGGMQEPVPPCSLYAETGSECRKQARKEGWVLNLREGTCVCPKCKSKGLKPGKMPE